MSSAPRVRSQWFGPSARKALHLLGLADRGHDVDFTAAAALRYQHVVSGQDKRSRATSTSLWRARNADEQHVRDAETRSLDVPITSVTSAAVKPTALESLSAEIASILREGDVKQVRPAQPRARSSDRCPRESCSGATTATADQPKRGRDRSSHGFNTGGGGGSRTGTSVRTSMLVRTQKTRSPCIFGLPRVPARCLEARIRGHFCGPRYHARVTSMLLSDAVCACDDRCIAARTAMASSSSSCL